MPILPEKQGGGTASIGKQINGKDGRMQASFTTGVLHFELLLVSVILLSIIFFNNCLLYKVRITDKISIMLAGSLFVSIFYYIWCITDSDGAVSPVSYYSYCGYLISFMITAAILNSYVVDQLGLEIRSRFLYRLRYYVPVVFMFFVCMAAPLICEISDVRVIEFSDILPILYSVNAPIIIAYAAASLITALVFLLKKEDNDYKRRVAVQLLIFIALAFGAYIIQDVILDLLFNKDDNYNPGLPLAVSLVFLTTNINTDRMIRNRSLMAAAEADLKTAAGIQRASLPKADNDIFSDYGVKVYASMDPAKEVGGDFYDFFRIDDDHFCFVIADVSGKGVPAALFMMTTKTMIKDHAMIMDSASEIFTDVNRRLCEDNAEGMFATAWIGILDIKNKMMRFTNAGHTDPCIRLNGGEYVFLKEEHDLVLAGLEDAEYTEYSMELNAGDSIFLYTDGLSEANITDKEFFGGERILQSLNRDPSLTGEALVNAVKKDVREFYAGAEQYDDITMMTITIA